VATTLKKIKTPWCYITICDAATSGLMIISEVNKNKRLSGEEKAERKKVFAHSVKRKQTSGAAAAKG
jgi:hypothetical protein